MCTKAGLAAFISYCLLSIFGVISGGESINECVSIEVSGSLYHSDTDGIYLLDSNVCNSRHQWIHVSGKRYLHYVLDGYDGWMIGPWSCHWGDFLFSIRTNKEEPYNLPGTWREFSTELSSWQNNTRLQVRCIDDTGKSVNCLTSSCNDGASCVTNNGISKCLCQHGFYGRFCETFIDTNHCKSSPCKNGASCSDLINDFQCKCTPGFSGRQCDISTDDIDCNTWPCHERCPNRPVLSCYSIRDVITIACLCAVVIIIILMLTFIARCIYVRQHNLPAKVSSSSEEELSWKDVSYKRLESLDSVLTMDRVGI